MGVLLQDVYVKYNSAFGIIRYPQRHLMGITEQASRYAGLKKNEVTTMDNLDYQILSELKKNARQTASDISKNIHLSVSTVIERIKKMEKSGLILYYTAITDDSKLGNDITVLMEISMEHPRYNEDFIHQVNTHPNIIACYYLTGEFDFLLKICCRSSDHLEQIHKHIKDCAGVRLTRTHYVLRTVKNIHSSLADSTT